MPILSRKPSPSCTREQHRRNRRLLFEQFEDRRMLAVAVDDSYSIGANQVLTVYEPGAWWNDTYDNNSSWQSQESVCVDLEHHDGYWDRVWIENQWVGQGNWNAGYYDGSWGWGDVWNEDEQAWEWREGYWDVNGQYHTDYLAEEWNEGSWDYYVRQDAHWQNTVWHDPIDICHQMDTITVTRYATAAVTQQPSHGTLSQTWAGAQSFAYLPHYNFVGIDSFTYSLEDAAGISTATVTLVVTSPGGQAPLAIGESYTATAFTPLIVSPGVLANDSDPENDPLTAFVGSNPQHGTLALQSNGSFTYTPNSGFSGWDTFIYRATDGYLQSAATINIFVGDPALAESDSYIVAQNTPLTVAAPGILANDMAFSGPCSGPKN